MLGLRILSIATFVAFPLLTSATQMSELGVMTSVPGITSIKWAGSADFQWLMPQGAGSRIPDDLTTIGAQDDRSSFSPDLFSINSAGEESNAAAADISVLGESEPEGRLTFSIFILIALGALLKCLSSPAFYEALSDVCFMVFAVENEGRD
jgi:hypothetical protein